MDKISEHLSTHEVACKCGCGYGTNIDDFSCQTAVMFEIIRIRVSEKLGKDTPLYISSGCRCTKHNKAVGGADQSRHIFGDALDIIKPVELDYDDFYEICDLVIGKKGGVGYYLGNKIIHIDTRGTKRRWTH